MDPIRSRIMEAVSRLVGIRRFLCTMYMQSRHDSQFKARMVTNGNLPDISIESIYSDIGNAYLEAVTKEKVSIIAVPEFGELEGHALVVYKALYVLRSSGRRWSEMGFEQCKSKPDIWMLLNDDLL